MDDVGDPPETILLNHPVEAVTRVLEVLEAVEFKWTVKQVLETEDSWIDDILQMKSIGFKIERNSSGRNTVEAK